MSEWDDAVDGSLTKGLSSKLDLNPGRPASKFVEYDVEQKNIETATHSHHHLTPELQF
jgi:hypothetical protein